MFQVSTNFFRTFITLIKIPLAHKIINSLKIKFTYGELQFSKMIIYIDVMFTLQATQYKIIDDTFVKLSDLVSIYCCISGKT